MMKRSYFASTIREFLALDSSHVLGELARHHGHDLDQLQRNAWVTQIEDLRISLGAYPDGYVMLEYAIPRMGKRVDVILLLGGIVFVLEFKVGAQAYERHAIDQVLDYALDLKNFHEGSHSLRIVPIVVATEAPPAQSTVEWGADRIASPAFACRQNLRSTIEQYSPHQFASIDAGFWLASGYKPTPTIVEAARALYEGHRVEDISRSDAGAINLSRTAKAISDAIEYAKTNRRKTICLVTGVPGSGKTLAGLNLATQRMRTDEDEHAVFLSGNGPLVTVLREALTRDEVARSARNGQRMTKKTAAMKTHAFIQNIHHFRDESLRSDAAPAEKVVVFDEAQRAWTQKQAARFMREKRQVQDFDTSEPEFLLSVMDRHDDWCVVVCLIGGGQEINTGEAGLTEWIAALRRSYRHWRILYSSRISDPEYSWGESPEKPLDDLGAETEPSLHLAVNVRSFRAEEVSDFVGAVIDGNADAARKHLSRLEKYPIVLTRSLDEARQWLRSHARGTERYGLVASSNAMRLKPVGVHVKAAIDPACWFLNPPNDVRSSYALEDVATEFDIQGLELDWVGVCWDANLRFVNGEWSMHSFSGTSWKAVNDKHRRIYLANAYRVLLTRARQGMVICVPPGNRQDPTRCPVYYDGIFDFLRECGIVRVRATGS